MRLLAHHNLTRTLNSMLICLEILTEPGQEGTRPDRPDRQAHIDQSCPVWETGQTGQRGRPGRDLTGLRPDRTGCILHCLRGRVGGRKCTQRHSPGVLAHNQIIGPVVGLTLRAMHRASRYASGAQLTRKFGGARTATAHFCACRHSAFTRMPALVHDLQTHRVSLFGQARTCALEYSGGAYGTNCLQ